MVVAMDKVGVYGAIFISAFSMYRYDASYAVEVQRAHPWINNSALVGFVGSCGQTNALEQWRARSDQSRLMGCPQRFPLAAFMRRSTSASVRYSRVRSSLFGRRFGLIAGRFGLTVRFTVAGVTSLRCRLAMYCAPTLNQTVCKRCLLWTVSQAMMQDFPLQ